MRGECMQLPTVFKPTLASIPPMYTWPRFIKRTLLMLAVLTVLVAYVMLAGGLVAIFAVLAERIN